MCSSDLGSINCCMDLEEAFNSNFSSTYKRPNRPQLLAQCRQEERETDHEYLTRWSNIRNTCEGVEELQATTRFANGCRHGTPLWQRLQRDPPKSLAEAIRIADQYALGDPMQPALDSVGATRRQPVNNRLGPMRPSDRHEYGYKRRDPDYRYGADQVAAVTVENPEPERVQRPKNEGAP